MRIKRCLFGCLLASLGVPAASQDLPIDRLREFVDYARLSHAAYQRDPLQPFGDPSSGLWQLRSRGAEDSGLNYDLFERRDAHGKTEWVVAFAGTEFGNRRGWLDGRDAGADVVQAFGGSRQYDDGLRAAERLVAEAKKHGIAISFTGHSLGGGMAQAASLRTGAPAVVFDSATLGPKYQRAPSPELQHLSNTNITNIRLEGDVVSLLPGDQLGQLYTIEMAPSVRQEMPSFWHPPALAGAQHVAVTHSLQNLITSGEAVLASRAGVSTQPVVAGAWSSGFNKSELESSAMAAQAAGAKRVVIYGNGGDADLMSEIMARRLGCDHVHRLPEGTSMHDVQRRARELGSDFVIGFRESWPQSPQPGQRTMLSREFAEKLASTTLSIGKAMNELGAYRYDKSPVYAVAKERLRLAGYVYDSYKLGRAIENDLRSAQHGDYVFVRSESLHEVVRIVAREAEKGVIKSLVGEKHSLDSFGFAEVARGHARQMATGQLDWQTAAHYLDGLNKAAWCGLGAAVSGGNKHAIDAFGTFGSVAATTLREASYDPIRRLHSTLSGADDAIVEAWRLDQQNRVRGNFEIQGLADYVREHRLPTLGLTASHVAQIDAMETQAYRRQQSVMHDTPPTSIADRARHQQQPVPGFYASYRPDRRDEPGVALESRLLVQMGRETRRAVVVGYGPEADRIHQRLVTRLGAENVTREQTNPPPSRLQRLAAEFGANAFFGSQPEIRTRITTHSQYRVVQGPATSARLDSVPTPLAAPASTWKPAAGAGPQPHFTTRPSYGVGGVMLDATAGVENGADMLASGRFALMFENGHAGIDLRELRRFVTALWAVYFSKDGPGVSIDPIAPDVDQHLVRYIGNVINTDLGRVMREADYMMKKWAVGTERADIPGFENPDDIAKRLGSLCAGGTSRFWFVPDDMRFRAAGSSILFQSGRVLLKTETLGRGGHVDRSNEEFAARFTANYPVIAAQYGIYEELFAYAKLISLARYLKENRVPMLWYLLANKDLILTEDSPGTVSELVKASDHHPRLTIKGGVDLKVPRSSTHYVLDAVTTSALNRAVAARATARADARTQTPSMLTVPDDATAMTVTNPEELSLSSAAVGGDVYQTDLAFRRQGEPDLEIVRHYNADHEGPATFGDDWHLLIPYRLRPADARRRIYRDSRVPEAITIHNQLTGSTEDLKFDADKYAVVGYVPPDIHASAVLGAFFLTDGSLRLVDKLGSEFHFDPTGELVAMLLTDDYSIELEYGDKTRPATAAEQAAIRLDVRDGVHARIGDFTLPVDLAVRAGDDSTAARFTLIRDDPDGRVRYRPLGERSPYSHATVLADGSVMLHEKRGRFLVFDGQGALRDVGAHVVVAMKQGPAAVAFDYEFAGFDCRIASAGVRVAEGGEPSHTVSYRYSEGRLAEVRSAGKTNRIGYADRRVTAMAAPQ